MSQRAEPKGGRKSDKIMKILIAAYDQYEGKWEEKKFRQLVAKTGLNKA